MPLQNRVRPTGEIVADPARGTLMGNRGILHDDHRRLGRRRWQHRTWITCVLEFNGRHRAVMTPHRYTELFFLDEAVAIAAGHRPCYECRRADYRAWQDAWTAAHGLAAPPRADTMDRELHRDRIDPATRTQRRWTAPLDALPDGTFVLLAEAPYLVLGDGLRRWTAEGYLPAEPKPADAAVAVLTPRVAVAVLAAGFRPRLHASATARKI